MVYNSDFNSRARLSSRLLASGSKAYMNFNVVLMSDENMVL